MLWATFIFPAGGQCCETHFRDKVRQIAAANMNLSKYWGLVGQSQTTLGLSVIWVICENLQQSPNFQQDWGSFDLTACLSETLPYPTCRLPGASIIGLLPSSAPSDSEPSVHSGVAIVMSVLSYGSKSSQPCKLHVNSHRVTSAMSRILTENMAEWETSPDLYFWNKNKLNI